MSLSTVLSDHPIASSTFALVGAVFVLSHALSFVKLVSQLVLVKGKSLKSYGAGKGAWAAITGPTGDIGTAFAHQIAKAGFNVVLIGRNPTKLGEIAEQLKSKYKVQTKEVVIDLGKPTPEAFEELRSMGREIEINVLVNNAGVSHEMPVYFSETEDEELLSILEVNTKSTLLITKALLPPMLARKNGLILTIGSFSALVPSAMLATYTGAKAFLERWSQALGEETKEFGVDVRLVLPYFVVSNMSKIRRPSLLIPTAPAFVRATLASIGQARGAAGRPYTSTPYWSHAVFDWAMGTFGLGGQFAISKGLAMHKDIRRRALAKKARLAKSQ
ncbi:hypothetical protein BDY24DRAFT_388672 [Mrakia frigida]|uniref:ketoreductase n=1 Tax=Mrakia frigida TaxID=29902 RepID=UPI003FCC254B